MRPLKQGPLDCPYSAILADCCMYVGKSPNLNRPQLLLYLRNIGKGGIRWEQEKPSLMLSHFNFVLA